MLDNYYANRVFQALFTIFSAITITFGLIRLMPGGPLDYLRAQLISEASRSGGEVNYQAINERLEAMTGITPDAPIYVQYVDYVVDILHGNLGQSIFYDEPVVAILGRALPWTILVSASALILTFVIGVTLGAVMAYLEGSRFDMYTTSGTIFLNSIPYFIAGLLMLFVLGYQLQWFPTGGRYDSTLTPGLTLVFLASVLHHAALPILSFVITGIDPLGMRGNSISVLGEDFVRVARLRGLSSARISIRYVGHNAILPFYTTLLISIGFLLGGSVIMEQIFSYPGVGYYLFESIGSRDYPVMMGGFLMLTIAVVLGVLFADLTYGMIDPRAGQGANDESY